MTESKTTKRSYKAYPWRILDQYLHDQCIAFQTQDAGGDLVELIYAGSRWVGKEERNGKA